MNNEQLSGFETYAQSVIGYEGTNYGMVRGRADRRRYLVVQGDTTGFAGDPYGHILLCPLTPGNAAALRKRLPWLNPTPLGLHTSAGFGDRLGIATPGHIKAAERYPGIAPIFAQQSVRENARTGRTPQQVMDDAMWGIFQMDWRAPWGADADHLKTPADADTFIDTGYTFFTIDPGAHVDNEAHDAPPDIVHTKFEALPWAELEDSPESMQSRYCRQTFTAGEFTFTFDQETLERAAAKYGRALAHTKRMYRHIVRRMGSKVASNLPFDLEVSVDETETPTSPEEHLFVAIELRRLGVQWVSLAPRFVGRFEKGVDYIGDLGVFTVAFARHAAIARAMGPYKLSLHSGSDKFSIYAIAAKLTGGIVHLKTAGTSYLEALRAVAQVAPAFFREIFAFSYERYETDRATYHVSAQLSKVPALDSLSDAELPDLLNQFDARQVLHVTFGSVLDSYRERLMALLDEHAAVYETLLDQHFQRHLKPLSAAPDEEEAVFDAQLEMAEQIRTLMPKPRARDAYMDLKTRLQNRLIDELRAHSEWTAWQYEATKRAMRESYDRILQEEHIILGRMESQTLFEQIVADIVGLGLLEKNMPDKKWHLHPDRFFDPDPAQRAVARELYATVAELPLVCPHGHVDPRLFVSEDASFGTPADLLIIPDHYVFRMLYSQGISLEAMGVPRSDGGPVEQDHRKIWQTFAENFHLFRGTPSGIWLQQELIEVFDVEEKLCGETAQAIYDHISAQLASPKFTPRKLFERFNIEVLCTTDAASDSLHYHQAIRDSGWSGVVLPTFRPDAVVNLDAPNWRANVDALSTAAGFEVNTYTALIQALEARRAFFIEMGAHATDHAALTAYTGELSAQEADTIFQRALKGEATAEDTTRFTGHMLMEMARMSIEDGLVMQMHVGSFRNHNRAVFDRFGPDKGCDIPVASEFTHNLRPLLAKYGNDPRLTLLLFTLDEDTYSRELATLAGHYPAIKLGPPWWFHDSLAGMRRYFERVMETAGLYNTAGFNDDTRAFPSIPARHDVWRRASANWVAGLVVRHVVDMADAREMILDLAYRLAKRAYKL